jgi:23S rRNA (cytosine1962-C5)-methyltransferase
MSRKTITLLKDAQGSRDARDHARGGKRMATAHSPWLFANQIRMDAAARATSAGSIVNVRGVGGEAVGTGYFNPASLIAVRFLDGACDTAIDSDFFASRIARTLTLRQALYEKPFYRLVNAEGDGLPGLVIDRFDDTLVVQITTAGMERARAAILAGLDKVVESQTVVLRLEEHAGSPEGLKGEVVLVKGAGRRVRLEENGVRYFADLTEGQKTGWYYDQRDNRAFIARLAKGKTVLDAYSYGGGFGIACAVHGAADVVCLDSSAPALALAEESARMNGVAIKPVKADVPTELERLAGQGETFGLVLADPPPFVRAKKDLEAGARAYRRLARLAALVVAPGGFLSLASCSHNITSDRFAGECASGIARTGRQARLIRQAGAGPDHPVHPGLPQSVYLKTLVYVLD